MPKTIEAGMIFEITKRQEIKEVQELGESYYEFTNSCGDIENYKKNFTSSWENLIKRKIGKIFVIEKNEKIIGGLGFLITPDTEDGTPICIGRFWWISESDRGEGLSLYRKVESYAKSVGCKKIIMGHLSFSNADKFKKVYTRIGFKENETTYIKHL